MVQEKMRPAWAPWLSLAAFVLLIALFLRGVVDVSGNSMAEKKRLVEQAVWRATVNCYAIEGIYPPNLEYLEENYGLIIDKGEFIVSYDAFASNIIPTIMVLEKSEGEERP